MKLTSPLLSAGVSGQKGKTLTYRQTKHGKILTPYAKPSQPNSPDQVAWRNTFSQSRDEWDALSPHLKQLWRSSAVSRRYRYAGYPMWMKYRMQDIRDGLPWNAYSTKLDWKYLPVLPGLVLWAQMEKGSGTTVYDFTRTNPGTIYGATWELVNEQIYGLNFDGSDDYVDCGNNTSLNVTSGITVESWIYIHTAGDTYQAVLRKQNAYYLRADEGGGYDFNQAFFVHIAGSWYKAYITDTIETGVWIHYVGTYDGSYIRLIKNTSVVAETSQSGAIDTSTDDLAIGMNLAGSNEYLNGIVAEVRIYNRALSEAEIVHNYLLLKNILQP